MVTTRNQAESGDSSRQAAAGEKHEVETENASPQPKRAKTEKQSADETPAEPETPAKSETPAAPKDEEMQDGTDGANGTEDPKQSTTDSKTQRGDAVRPSEEKDVPSNVLEKGIIHFFVRGRVNVEEPSGVNDIARSFILLRPIAKDAKLGDGTIQDSENTRLLMLPKKVIPQSGKDRFMAFVEKPKASYDDLKESFLAGNDYQTKTAGTRHTPAATPVGEGVYAITSTGRESHLVYILTLPETLGSAQAELGLKNRDSFIISTRNPKFEAPGNARLPKGPEFSKEVMDEFHDLRWLPSKPEHFDFANAQILLIGESAGIDKAVQPQEGEEGKEEPLEVLEHLEDEDLKRMKHLPGDQSASLFADLDADAKNYPRLQTQF